MTNKNIEKKKAATKTAAKVAPVAEKKAPVVEEKKAPVVEEKKPVEKAPVVEEKKAPVVEEKKATEKAPAKKTTARKTTTKRTTKKKEVQPEVYIQFSGNESVVDVITKKAKDQFIAEGHKEEDIKSLKIYLKPEDNAAYYVVNEENAGKVDLF